MRPPLSPPGGSSPRRHTWKILAVIVVVLLVGGTLRQVFNSLSAVLNAEPGAAAPAASANWQGVWLRDGSEFGLLEFRPASTGRLVVSRDAVSDIGLSLEAVDLSSPEVARFAVTDRAGRRLYRLTATAPDTAELTFEWDEQFARDQYLRAQAVSGRESLHAQADRERWLELRQNPPQPRVVGTFRRAAAPSP